MHAGGHFALLTLVYCVGLYLPHCITRGFAKVCKHACITPAGMIHIDVINPRKELDNLMSDVIQRITGHSLATESHPPPPLPLE
jgi:hypothetical protein